jgi:hypothetical protein
MGHLAHVLRPSRLTHGRLSYSFPLSPRDVVPMVPDLISSLRVLGKQALSRCIGSSYLGEVAKCPSRLRIVSLSATQLWSNTERL